MHNHKYRMTQQRQIILVEVRRRHTHPTADELYEIVRKKIPRISMGTVYRNLDILSKIGLIKKIDPSYPQMRFDGNTHDHAHIVCMACGRIEDAQVSTPSYSLDNFMESLSNLTDFKVFGHNLKFLGLCPLCMKEGKTSLGNILQELQE